MTTILRSIIFISILMLTYIQVALASHNRAGEITYRQLASPNFTIEATVTTYTKASSETADRDSIDIIWGDGSITKVIRNNGPMENGVGLGELLPNDTRYNTYVAIHTYPGAGHYTIGFTDPNRNADICNLNGATPDNIPFYISTTVTLFPNTFQGLNSSPILLQAPIDIGCVGQPFIHNPNAFDPDGDSLAYRLIVPLQDDDDDVPLYIFPENIVPGPNNNFFFNQKTGDLDWVTPQRPCEYNIAMYIIEYRNGTPIDTLIRDMQILIKECDNIPPEIETIDEICVVAGETIEFDVTATAPIEDTNQKVNLTATGGPFQVSDPATFQQTPFFQEQPLVRTFRWETQCEHISDQFYTVIFRAADDFPISIEPSTGDTSSLSTLKRVRIKVVGPPPEDVTAVAESGQVEVTWENPYSCENADNEYFRGFTLWRRLSSNNFPVDTCETGLEGKGYTKITPAPIQDIVSDRYYYLDLEVERGRTYCYRILGNFAKVTASGFTFNRVESIPSQEVCVQLSRDIPLITNVSVLETDATDGKIKIAWSKPVAEDLDTLLNPGPYIYELWRASGINGSDFQIVPGATFTSPTFFGANDTMFIDETGLNTLGSAYSYQVAFYTSDIPEALGFTPPASSIFLNVGSTDETNILTWDENVPWSNFTYRIFRLIGNDFVFIDSTMESQYMDTDLFNGVEYCYKIETVGSYGIEGVLDPLFNFSQENCGTPLDTIPPCPPILTVNNICDEVGDRTPEEAFINNLNWTNPNLICVETDDVVAYNVYYTPIDGGNFEIIASFDLSTDTLFEHKPDIGIAGCYAITALDTFNNESAFSNIICVDNCPEYTLPNAFTPNGDGQNELFIPYPYRFIDRIDIQVFNRWGNLVFQTTNPDIQWDGKNQAGKDLADGVYFYSCRVFENRVEGIRQRPEILSGYIELIR